MKLRNKKTGKINYGDLHLDDFNSLAELNEEWEDYEEPSGYWYIDFDGDVLGCVEPFDEETEEGRKQIGNYFETKEDAEKGVEKLKAWKRLKDKGFRLDCYMRRSDWADLPEVNALENLIDITAYLPKDKIEEMKADLDLLFGGEE